MAKSKENTWGTITYRRSFFRREGDTHDFTPSTDEELSVEVDRSATDRKVHCLVR